FSAHGSHRSPGKIVTPRRYEGAVITADSNHNAELAARFLRTEHGRARVYRVLAGCRLSSQLADDLIQDALRQVCVAVDRGTHIDNVEAFVTRLLQRSAVDIVRGRTRRPQAIARRPDVDPHAE